MYGLEYQLCVVEKFAGVADLMLEGPISVLGWKIGVVVVLIDLHDVKDIV